MAPQLLFDLSQIDLEGLLHDVADIERINPHRGAMRLVDGVIWENAETQEILGFRDIGDDEFWVPGHFPGRPPPPRSAAFPAGWHERVQKARASTTLARALTLALILTRSLSLTL